MPIRNRTTSVAGLGLDTATMSAAANGPRPAVVKAAAAARCPASHASSLRIVDGMRMPAKRFLRNRPAAAIRPSTTTMTPPNPDLVALTMHLTLWAYELELSPRRREFASFRTSIEIVGDGTGAFAPLLGPLSVAPRETCVPERSRVGGERTTPDQ